LEELLAKGRKREVENWRNKIFCTTDLIHGLKIR